MDMTAEAFERDTSFSDDPFDMETSGALPMEGFFLAKEAGISLNSRLASAEVDFSFLDGEIDEYEPGTPVRHVPAFLEKRTWSSLAVVLLLHATLACIFPVFGKPAAQGPKIIETQLVLLPGGSNQAGGQPSQGGAKTRKNAKSVSPARPVAAPPPARRVPAPPSPPARVKRKSLKPDRAARVHKILAPVRKVHAHARRRPDRAARMFHHAAHRKVVTTAQPIKRPPIKRPQTEPGAIQSQRPDQNTAVAAPRTGKQAGSAAAGALSHGGPGKIHGPGGPGASDVAFGSPNGPRFLHKVAPAYPALARKLGKQGTVLLRVTIDAHGRPVKVEVLRKAGFGMDQEAVKAIEQSTFVPARRGGRPFTCKALLPIKFVLDAW